MAKIRYTVDLQSVKIRCIDCCRSLCASAKTLAPVLQCSESALKGSVSIKQKKNHVNTFRFGIAFNF